MSHAGSANSSSREITSAQAPSANDVRTVSAERGGIDPRQLTVRQAARGCARPGRQARQGRRDPADLVAQLAQPFRVLVAGDVTDMQRHAALRNATATARPRRSAIVGIDDQLDIARRQSRGNRIDQLGVAETIASVAAVADIAADVVEQIVHGAAAVAVELDPHAAADTCCSMRCTAPPRLAGVRRRAARRGGRCARRAPSRTALLAASSTRRKRWNKSRSVVSLEIASMGHSPGEMRDRASPDNAHIGEKSDDFGSRTERVTVEPSVNFA